MKSVLWRENASSRQNSKAGTVLVIRWFSVTHRFLEWRSHLGVLRLGEDSSHIWFVQQSLNAL